MSKHIYEPIAARDVPSDLIWIVPERNQGQIVEVAYSRGIPAGRDVNYDADSGDPWKRVSDKSDGTVDYYRLVRS